MTRTAAPPAPVFDMPQRPPTWLLEHCHSAGLNLHVSSGLIPIPNAASAAPWACHRRYLSPLAGAAPTAGGGVAAAAGSGSSGAAAGRLVGWLLLHVPGCILTEPLLPRVILHLLHQPSKQAGSQTSS